MFEPFLKHGCKYLKECRRPKEEGWKCYDGCRIIKEKQGTGKYNS